MPCLEDITYSREATVAAIRDYYQFLVKLYLDESSILYPPEGGWPEIKNAAPNILNELGKTEEVVSLLAELPYIRADGGRRIDGAPENTFADWLDNFRSMKRGADGDGLRLVSEGYEFYRIAPPHVIGLTSGADQEIFVLDTELGIVSWYEVRGEISIDASREPVLDDPEDYAPENELEWRYGTVAWAIPDFFELLKDQYRMLHFIPVSPCSVTDVWITPRLGNMIPELQQLYQEHGWPDVEQYRKHDCMTAVAELLRRKYPSEADNRNRY